MAAVRRPARIGRPTPLGSLGRTTVDATTGTLAAAATSAKPPRHNGLFADAYDCADLYSHADSHSHADQHTDIDRRLARSRSSSCASKSYPGSDLVIEETLQPGANYNRYVASYKSTVSKSTVC